MLPLISTTIALFFGVAAVILSFREDKVKKQLIERERKLKQRLYEITILKEIQDRIGYELDLEKVIDVIVGSLKDLFPYSTASSLFFEDGSLIFKSNLQEEVSRDFIDQVKKAMLASLSELLEKPLSEKINEGLYGAVINDSNTKPMSSFFHIPLTVNNKVLGLISIASTTPGLYKEDEMTILYQITNQAANALSKLQNVLTTEKSKLMAMIGSLADGVFMVDTSNKLLVINDSAKRLLNINKDKPSIFDIISASSEFIDFAEKIKQSISENIQIVEKDVSLGEKIVQVFITPVVGENAVFGASILLQDVTLEKNLLKMKEDFTNIIIHELRAPLTAIKGAAEVMVGPSKLEEEEQKKLLKIIDEQVKKLLDEVSLLLDAGKIEAGQFTLNKEKISLKKLIDDRIQVFIPLAKTKKIIIKGIIPDDLPPVSCDQVRIEQVINNLMSNSLKFTGEGGNITLSAKIENDKNHIAVSVTDTGIGIPKKRQRELFLKFSQIAYPTQVYTKQYPILGTGNKYNLSHLTSGTGLGLFIVKAIVEAHKGEVKLESEEGKGTTISFILPRN